MAIKFVRYNGGTESYQHCSSPEILKKGRVYLLERQVVHPWHTDYYLRDVPGYYNSVWFDDVELSLDEETLD